MDGRDHRRRRQKGKFELLNKGWDGEKKKNENL
jgi:hypothetical protein